MPRELNEDEKLLLAHINRFGSGGYPIRRINARCWTWGFKSIKHPSTFPTRKKAVESFEVYHEQLVRRKGELLRRKYAALN